MSNNEELDLYSAIVDEDVDHDEKNIKKVRSILSQPTKLDNTDDVSTVSRTETTGTWRDKYQESLYAVCPFDYETEQEYLEALEKAEAVDDDDAEDDIVEDAEDFDEDDSEDFDEDEELEDKETLRELNIEDAISKIFSDSLIFDLAENYDQKEKVSVVTGDIVTLVSVQNLFTYTTKFEGKEIQLRHELATQSGNNPKRKSIYCYRIKGSDEGFGVDYSKSLEVFYDKLPDVKRLVMINFPATYAIKVKGKVMKYSNSDDIYIQATEIGGLEKLLEGIQEPESPMSRYAEFRQIIAFPSLYENRPYAIRGDLVVLENHPDTETLVLCESTGLGQNDYNDNIKIEISYKTCPNHDRLLALKANHQKVKVRGYVGIKEDKSAYMVGRVINIVNSFVPKVSIKMLLAFPQRYMGQIARIEEQMAITSNEVRRKSFYAYQSKGTGQFEINTDTRIEIFYRNLPYAEKCVMIDANYQRIYVEGKVCKYNNSNDIYIEGTDISGDCIK